MQPVVRDLLMGHIDSLAKLEVALHYHAHPEAVETIEALADRLCRSAGEVRRAVEGLVASGLLRRDVLGAGHYVLYALTDHAPLQAALARLSALYHDDPETRVAIVKHVMGIARQGVPAAPRVH